MEGDWTKPPLIDFGRSQLNFDFLLIVSEQSRGYTVAVGR